MLMGARAQTAAKECLWLLGVQSTQMFIFYEGVNHTDTRDYEQWKVLSYRGFLKIDSVLVFS